MKFICFLICFGCFCLVTSAQVDQQQVDDFARNYGFSQKVPLASVEAALAEAEFQPSIIEKMERPAEAMPWHRYRKIFITEDRINAGVKFWKENEVVLEDVSARTGVPPEIIVGILGVESYYGTRKGSYRVLDALYTLAFGYPKRASFFRSELEKFLQLTEQENLDIAQIKGSYAGAIGYCQFMPSSYLAYAKNYDGKGGTDLMNNVDDAIASVANYLQVHRWKKGEKVAVRATTGAGVKTLPKQSVRPGQSISYYANLGYTPADGSSISSNVTLQEFELEEGKEFWFGLNNFYVITRYNHSSLYALAVHQLAEAVKEQKGKGE